MIPRIFLPGVQLKALFDGSGRLYERIPGPKGQIKQEDPTNPWFLGSYELMVSRILFVLGLRARR